MSLQAWDWEDEDTGSMGPMSSVGSFCPSLSECDVEEYMNARAQNQEAESDQLFGSFTSATTFYSDEPHVVPCKFIISLAFPGNAGPKRKHTSLMEKCRKFSKMDRSVAKSNRVYHVEYFLLPDDKEPKTTDVLVFPSMVKLFLDSGVKTVKPWHDGDKLWVSWTQMFKINVTRELLKKINFHKITFRLWETTDKTSKSVRSYRLKTSINLEDAGSFEEVKQLVLNQKRSSEQSVQMKEEWDQEYEPEKPERGKSLKSFRVKWKESQSIKKRHGRRKKFRGEEGPDHKRADHWKQRAFTIHLAIMPLLAEVPIMTEEQKRDLNPLIIRIKAVSCLPSQPVAIEELAKLCTPVYCRYQFHKTPVHHTEGQPHGSHVSFQDINVILLGAMDPSDVREYLEGPPMVVEVHDRDRKSEEYSQKPTLFGEGPLDLYLNLQALISPKETETNPFESLNKMWDPYGVAQVSFADLLLGQKYMNLAVPIQNCEFKPLHQGQGSRSRKVVGFGVPTESPHRGPMPMGNYLDANSLLKLRVDITVPLRAMAEAPDLDLTGTQFGRIIFVFDSRKIFLLHSLLQDITMINAKALDLDSYPITNIRQILSAFKVRVKIQERQDLDVLTGFHLLDGKVHLLVLEGLAGQGLKRLWESHQSRITKSECGKHKVLYNSQLLFQHRLYADLDTILYHVHLFKPLSQLMKRVGTYLRNTVMQRAFRTLTRIYCICHYSTKLREVITRNLLPSSAMIQDLSQEFGLPNSLEELTNEKLLTIPSHPSLNLEYMRGRKPTLTSEILAHQEKYLRWRNTVLLDKKDQHLSLIRKNITDAYQVSKKLPKSLLMRSSAPTKNTVHNYSIQTLNSTALVKKELYGEMSKEPGRRFTYSQNFLSATVEPQDSKEEEKKAKKKARQAWVTASGFRVTGLHKGTEGGHRLQLLPIGTAQPPKEWKESAPKPVLGREQWSWDQRHQDFDLYKKPPPFLKLPASPARSPATGRTMEGSGPVS